jgi:hypothetical protein
MPPPKIALFADKDNRQMLMLRDLLLEEGAEPLVFDMQLGGPSAPTMALGAEHLVWEGVDFTDITAIHVRSRVLNTPATMPPLTNVATYSEIRCKYLREQEYQAAAFSFLERLESAGKLVINKILTGAYIDHDTKAQLYQKLRSWGFLAPKSIMTNDPDRARAFVHEMGEVVAKPSAGIGSTRKITEKDMERLDELRMCPVLMQEFFAGDTLRIHIVGDTVVLALRIISSGDVDSRTLPQGFEYFKLPGEEERKIVRANRMLGLHFATWDILATNDGRYVYLDCNAGSFILWIGDEYAQFVLRQLGIYMLTYARGGSIAEASAQVKAWHPH